MTITMRLLIFCTFFITLLTTAHGQDLRVSGEIHAYNRELNLRWVSVTINNPTSREVGGYLRFDAEYYQADGQVRYNVGAVGPGETRRINLAVPMVNNARFNASNGISYPLNINAYQHSDTGLSSLFVADASNMLSVSQLDDFSRTMNPDVGSRSRHMSGMMSGSSVTTSTSPLLNSERIITQVVAEDLPENWLCLAPLSNIIMSDALERGLAAPQRTALETWVSLGGNLHVYDATEVDSETVGRGKIFRTIENPVETPRNIDLSSVFSSVVSALNSQAMPFHGQESGGRFGALFLTTAFLIIAGPVTYFRYSRRGEIRKIMVAVPIISVAFCALMVGYFILSQGFTRKGGTMSYTVVDEASDRAVTYSVHSLLSGLYPSQGFQFSPQTYLSPTSGDWDHAVLDITRSRVLQRGMFTPGVQFNYSTVTPYTTRERMVYDAQALTISNGFELPIEAVAVYHDGKYYSGGSGGSGGSVSLEPVNKLPDDEWPAPPNPNSDIPATLAGILGGDAGNLSRSIMDYQREPSAAIYMARFNGSPKTAEPGVDINDGSDYHYVIGFIPEGQP